MEITRIDGPEAVYCLSGKLSFADNEDMRPLLEDMGRGSDRTLVLDLTQLDYVDSFGIGLFLVALDEVKKAGNRLVVRNPQGAVKRIFTLANLDTLLEIEGDKPPTVPVSAARAAMSPLKNGLTIGPLRQDTDGGFAISLSGRFTFNDHDEFDALLSAVAASANKTLAIDLRGLEFMDSAGLSMLLIAREEAERHDTKLILLSPTGRVSHLLRLAAVDTLVEIREA